MKTQSLMLLFASGLGCSGAPTSADSTGSSGTPTGPLAEPDSIVIASDQPGSIHVRGRTFVPITDEYLSHPPPDKPLKDMTIEQIAWAITPILGFEGKRYQPTTLDFTVPRAIKAGVVLGNVVGSGVPGALPTVQAKAPLHTQYLFDPNGSRPELDDQRQDDSSNGYPFLTVVYIQDSLGNCSGTYIGPSGDTLITAAHCLRSNGVSHNYPATLTPDAFGFNGTVTDERCGNWTGGYFWWYQTAWDSKGCPPSTSSTDVSCFQFDVAIMDFSPNGNPTVACTGTMGIDINLPQWEGIKRDGYPGPYNYVYDSLGRPNEVAGSQNVACTTVNTLGAYPFLCGSDDVKTLGLSETLDGWRVESWQIGATPGDSGGPWWGFFGDTNIAAVTNGSRSYFDLARCGFDLCYRNFGRVIDQGLFDWINSVSNL